MSMQDKVNNVPGLTRSQTRIYNNLITALTHTQIYKKLNLSSGGVRCHTASILSIFDANSRLDLICQHYAESNDFNLIDHDFINKFDKLESDIFTYTIKGYSTKETAYCLGFKIGVVIYARKRIYKIADVKNAYQLVYKCYGIKEDVE
jgi:DNA-binding CsgD family transcriptional regulator